MTIQRAIELAISGGYREFESVQSIKTVSWPMVYGKENGIDKLFPLHSIILDPQFWQCLGKSMGWGNYNNEAEKEMNWKDYWHDFIDHLANNGTIESYFASLDEILGGGKE